MVKVLLAGQEPLSGNNDAALIPRYVRIGRRPTSFRLEAATWNLLCGGASGYVGYSRRRLSIASGIVVSQPWIPLLEERPERAIERARSDL